MTTQDEHNLCIGILLFYLNKMLVSSAQDGNLERDIIIQWKKGQEFDFESDMVHIHKSDYFQPRWDLTMLNAFLSIFNHVLINMTDDKFKLKKITKDELYDLLKCNEFDDQIIAKMYPYERGFAIIKKRTSEFDLLVLLENPLLNKVLQDQFKEEYLQYEIPNVQYISQYEKLQKLQYQVYELQDNSDEDHANDLQDQLQLDKLQNQIYDLQDQVDEHGKLQDKIYDLQDHVDEHGKLQDQIYDIQDQIEERDKLQSRYDILQSQYVEMISKINKLSIIVLIVLITNLVVFNALNN
jgi:hypothetical protein